jgi:threonine aldolase
MHHDRSFTSDNISPISPEILEAILNANHGTQASYGNDEWSRQLTQAAQAVFECELEFIHGHRGQRLGAEWDARAL